MRMIAAIALAATGCMANPPPAANGVQTEPATAPAPDPELQQPPDQPGHAYGGLNETIRLGALTVKPVEVIEDSRCPVEMVCDWSGRVVVRAEISGVPGQATISSLEPFALPGGRSLVLASVWPPKGEGGPNPSYRFGLTRR